MFHQIVVPSRRFYDQAQMAESVDALVSNTSGATRAGSTPALGTGKAGLRLPFPVPGTGAGITLFLCHSLQGKKTGIIITMAITENSMPLITPTAKLYQNWFCLPSKRNGIRPRTVLSIVSMVGTIFLL